MRLIMSAAEFGLVHHLILAEGFAAEMTTWTSY